MNIKTVEDQLQQTRHIAKQTLTPTDHRPKLT